MAIQFIVPYYMDPKYLFELIDSVRAQTRDEWRLTIVDDQYPDTTAEEHVRSLNDPRIEYLRNEQNLGVIKNVVKCLQLGTEEYFVLMGADDALEPRYVEVVLDAFKRHPDAIMVHPGVLLVDGDSQPTDTLGDKMKRFISREAWKHSELDARTAVGSLMHGNWPYAPALAIRTDVVDRVQHLGEWGCVGDLAWIVDMLLGGGTMALDPTPVFRYRRHASHSADAVKGTTRFDEEQRYFGWAAKEMDKRGWRKEARAARAHFTSRGNIAKASLESALAGNFKLAGALAHRTVKRV